MKCPALAPVLVVLIALGACAQQGVQPGSRPPLEVLERVKPALDDGRRALDAKDAEGLRVAVRRAVEALGPWAGNPETATKHFPPANTAPPDLAAAPELWLKEMERGLKKTPWILNPVGDPKTMTAGLRAAAVPLSALARTALALPEQREKLTPLVRTAADWLLARQQPNGVFPFPVGPGLNPQDKVGHIVARAMKEHPEIVVNGWIPDDRTDGGLQFDHGLCGTALIDAWELTQDERYLAAARRAGDWAAARPLVSNWNYNSFSAGFLAKLARASGEAKYLEASVEKAAIGVLPGQLPMGRWFDAHNACAFYHNILLRELLEVFSALPAEHAFRPTLRDALVRGLDQAATETLAQGFTGTWTECFARALSVLGEKKAWRDALNANLNASGQRGAPTLGVAIVAVLELAAKPSK